MMRKEYKSSPNQIDWGQKNSHYLSAFNHKFNDKSIIM